MQLLLIVGVLATLLSCASACKKFNEGAWAKAHKPNWKYTAASPACVAMLNNYPYSFQSHKWSGYFVTVPSNAPRHYQTDLNSLMIFKWHCLTSCVDQYGASQTATWIGINKGTPFQDSGNPKLVTLSCKCNTGMTIPTINMEDLDTKWMATCHYKATTTTLSTLPPTTTTTEIPMKFDGVIPIGCFDHTKDFPRLPKMTELFPEDGFAKIYPMSPEVCASRCFTMNPDHLFAGVTQGEQCWCGLPDAGSQLNWWSSRPSSDCSTWLAGYADKSAIPCFISAGNPAFTSATDFTPAAPHTWCGGNHIMEVFEVKQTVDTSA